MVFRSTAFDHRVAGPQRRHAHLLRKLRTEDATSREQRNQQAGRENRPHESGRGRSSGNRKCIVQPGLPIDDFRTGLHLHNADLIPCPVQREQNL